MPFLFSFRLSVSKGGSDGVMEGSKSPLGSSRNSSSIPLTGDSKADADIIAFYKARQKLIGGLKQQQQFS